MVNQFSLYDSFSGVPGNATVSPAGATDLIKTLIQVVGHHVSEFKRNTLSAYRIVQRSCDLYNEINKLILEADKEDGWDSYDKYTKAIDPLEKILFEISDITERESILWLPEPDNISDCVESINSWARARQLLRKLSDNLQTHEAFNILPPDPGFGKSAQRHNSNPLQRHDDSSLITALCRDIEKNQHPDVRGPELSQCKSIAAAVPSKISVDVHDNLTVMTIKCLMLIHGIMQVSEKTLDRDLKLKLAATDLWKDAQRLLSNLSSHLDKASSDVAGLQKEWDDLIKLLENQDAPVSDIPKQYYELKKLVCGVRRHYHSRALVLVSHCRIIAERFKERKSTSNLKPLISAIEAAEKALKLAADGEWPVDLVALYDVDVETGVVAEAFYEAETQIHECFKKYQIGQWNERAAEMDAALRNDKLRVGQMKTRLQEYKRKMEHRNRTAGSSSTRFNVTVRRSSGTSETYAADETTPLRAILWREINKNPNIPPGSHFRRDSKDGEIIDMDTQVGDLPERDAERIVYLRIAGNA